MDIPEFETVIKLLVMAGGFLTMAIGGAFAVKGLLKKPPADAEALDRIHDVEARVAELEERLDSTERALSDMRARAQIPPRT